MFSGIRFSLALGVVVLAALGAGSPAPAKAFGVDVCYNSPTSGEAPIRNCIGVEEICRTSNLTGRQPVTCRVAATADSLSGLSGGNAIIGGRSLVHSDSTYLMAQLLGFTPWQAYQVMIYDEATDQSDYFPFDQNGAQMMSDTEIADCRANWGATMPRRCLVITPVMNGIYKFNDAAGGMLLHLHARYSPNGAPPPAIGYPANYLMGPNAPFEPLLNNLQDWVFEQRPDACVAGMVLPTRGNSGKRNRFVPCEATGLVLNSPASFFAAGVTRLQIPFQSNLGRLVVNETETATIPAEDQAFSDYIYPHDTRFAKPGIFFHSLADRYSHHLCTDVSYFFRLNSGNYDSNYAQVPCAQGSHFLWHVWEQGTVQDTTNLAPQYQTMRPALEAVYDQLVAYGRLRGIVPRAAVNKEQVFSDLVNVLEIYDPKSRLDAMVVLIERYRALPLPGHGASPLSIETWLARAGVPAFPPSPPKMKTEN